MTEYKTNGLSHPTGRIARQLIYAPINISFAAFSTHCFKDLILFIKFNNGANDLNTDNVRNSYN